MPTIKQTKAFDKTMENTGNVSKAMREVGYSENTAKNPKTLTDSKGWEELVKAQLSDKTLLKKHKELLNTKSLQKESFPKDIEDEEIKELLKAVNCSVKKIRNTKMAKTVYYTAVDTKALKDALDMAYKVKGRYKEKVEHSLTLTSKLLSRDKPSEIE